MSHRLIYWRCYGCGREGPDYVWGGPAIHVCEGCGSDDGIWATTPPPGLAARSKNPVEVGKGRLRWLCCECWTEGEGDRPDVCPECRCTDSWFSTNSDDPAPMRAIYEGVVGSLFRRPN